MPQMRLYERPDIAGTSDDDRTGRTDGPDACIALFSSRSDWLANAIVHFSLEQGLAAKGDGTGIGEIRPKIGLLRPDLAGSLSLFERRRADRQIWLNALLSHLMSNSDPHSRLKPFLR